MGGDKLMSIKERKERERDERRELILNAANEIIKTEGIDNLSIRKIANKIEYSPTIIYYYFNSKDDIIKHLMKRGYQKIISLLSSVQETTGDAKQKFEESIRKYIYMALQIADEYKAVLLNSSPGVLEHTSVLFKGASSKRQAIGMLCQYLKDIYNNKSIDDTQIELTAQVIWTSTFGLIIRLIIEKDIDEAQKKKLIDHHINFIVNGLLVQR